MLNTKDGGKLKLISEAYRKQNTLLHESPKKYGQRGHRHLGKVRRLRKRYECGSVLDYGCGKADLSKHAEFHVHNYDPAIPEYAYDPKPADLVVCTDVMEHIEPTCLEAVLQHLEDLTIKAIYLCIATRPDSSKTLPDGSNPHKIIQDADFWINLFSARFNIIETDVKEGEVYITAIT